jgi:hypothetical protein
MNELAALNDFLSGKTAGKVEVSVSTLNVLLIAASVIGSIVIGGVILQIILHALKLA